MKKFNFGNFGKVFALMAAAAVFGFVFAGCDDLSGAVRDAFNKGEPKKAEATDKDKLKDAFEDPGVEVVEITDDIEADELELIIPAGDKTISIPGNKETSLGSLKLSAGSHVKIVNADDGGTAKSVGGALLAEYSQQDYYGWATLVIWNNFVIPDGATFDLIGRTRLVFRTAVVDGKLAADNEDSILGAGEETPTITGGGKVQTGEVEKDAAQAADGINNSGEHKEPPALSDSPPPVPPAGPLPPIKFYNTDYASGTAFDTEGWTGAGADDEAWTLTAGEYGTVFFAVNKAEGQTITVDGADAELVTVYESGSVEGAAVGNGGEALSADGTRTVFAVKTGDLLFEGGTRTFTLNGGENTIPVTVNVTPNLTGAAVFLVERVNDVEFLTRRDTGTEAVSYTTLNGSGSAINNNTGPANPAPFNGSAAMMDALAWVDKNAGGSDEWLIRVEDAETSIPRTLLGSGLGDGDTRIKIRLRGHNGTEHIIKHDGSLAIAKGDNSFYGKNLYRTLVGSTYGFPASFSPNGSADGMINVCGRAGNNGETVPYLTLQLERGITLKGLVDKNPGTNDSTNFEYRNMVNLAGNAGLVMKAGSKITGHYMSANSQGFYSVIRREKTHTVSPTLQAVSIEAGAQITGNKLKGFNSQISGDKTGIIYLVNKQKIFISKNAIIQDNVATNADDVNFAHAGAWYSIKSDGNMASDIIISFDNE